MILTVSILEISSSNEYKRMFDFHFDDLLIGHALRLYLIRGDAKCNL